MTYRCSRDSVYWYGCSTNFGHRLSFTTISCTSIDNKAYFEHRPTTVRWLRNACELVYVCLEQNQFICSVLSRKGIRQTTKAFGVDFWFSRTYVNLDMEDTNPGELGLTVAYSKNNADSMTSEQPEKSHHQLQQYCLKTAQVTSGLVYHFGNCRHPLFESSNPQHVEMPGTNAILTSVNC